MIINLYIHIYVLRIYSNTHKQTNSDRKIEKEKGIKRDSYRQIHRYNDKQIKREKGRILEISKGLMDQPSLPGESWNKRKLSS